MKPIELGLSETFYVFAILFLQVDKLNAESGDEDFSGKPFLRIERSQSVFAIFLPVFSGCADCEDNKNGIRFWLCH